MNKLIIILLFTAVWVDFDFNDGDGDGESVGAFMHRGSLQERRCRRTMASSATEP